MTKMPRGDRWDAADRFGHSCAIFGRHIEISRFLANVFFPRKLNYVNNFVF
jgi:hypothetical protein